MIAKALLRNGFIEHPSHHKQYTYYTLVGKKTKINTYISHGNKDYGDYLLKEVARQIKLTNKDLLRFIDGDMTREEYEGILRIKGIIE